MCSPLDPLSCAEAIRRGLADPAAGLVTGVVNSGLDSVLAGLTDQLHAGIKFLSLVLAGWILVPSTSVCPPSGADVVSACTGTASPSAQVRGWLLPVTALVAVLGMVWQGITMAITRKGEPLITVAKGLFSVALWGVVGIAGTQLALRAGDAYAYWILQQAIFGDSLNPTEDLGSAITSMSAGESYAAVLVLLLLQIPFFVATLVQILLMVFREGAVIILAGQLQLAAAGGFTRLTSGWLAKVTGWMLALIAYKPIAATIYAVAFALMGDGIRNLVMGLAVMLLALIALPALMRFFNWTVGAVGHGGSNALGILGTSLAAGMHGASATRGIGGYGATDHARWLDSHGPIGGAGTPTDRPTGSAGAAASASASTAASFGSTAAAGASGGVTLAADVAVRAKQETQQQVRRAADHATGAMEGE